MAPKPLIYYIEGWMACFITAWDLFNAWVSWVKMFWVNFEGDVTKELLGPTLRAAECNACGRSWMAFLVEGIIGVEYLECPSCGEEAGQFTEED